MDTTRRTHPLVILAASTVSLFSLAGIGAVMGWIPTSIGQNASAVVAPIPEQPAQPEPPKPAERRVHPKPVEKPGQASGVGAVGGAVVGGVLGHQVGSGRGKDLATILGAVGGAFGGNQVEKTVKKEKEYQIVVRYDDGSKGTFTQATEPGWHRGDKVKVINGAIQSNG